MRFPRNRRSSVARLPCPASRSPKTKARSFASPAFAGFAFSDAKDGYGSSPATRKSPCGGPAICAAGRFAQTRRLCVPALPPVCLDRGRQEPSFSLCRLGKGASLRRIRENTAGRKGEKKGTNTRFAPTPFAPTGQIIWEGANGVGRELCVRPSHRVFALLIGCSPILLSITPRGAGW